MNNRKHNKTIPAMLPVKKWLTQNEAAAYMSVGATKLKNLIIEYDLTISRVGRTAYFKVNELDAIFKKSTIYRQSKQ